MRITGYVLVAPLFSAALLIGCQSSQTQDGNGSSETSTERSTDQSGEPTLEKTQQEPQTRKIQGQGCIGGNCDTGTGTFIYESGDRYTGPFEKGQREGTGVMEYANGDRYEGEYHADIRQGNGTYIFRNKDVYAGRFNAGGREGKGAYTFAETGEVFEGEFAEDGQKANGFIKRGDNYYLCKITDSKLFCTTTPVKDPGKLRQ